MITVDELRGVRIFAPVQPDALDFLCRAVEDITLVPGEYFVHEGEARIVAAGERWPCCS